MTIELLGAAIGAGLLGAMLGLGGGVFLVPILVLVFNLGTQTAIGTSIVAVIATSAAAAGNYLRVRLTNIRLGLVLELTTTLGAVAGGLIATTISGNLLAAFFAAVLIYTAITMFYSSSERPVVPAINSDNRDLPPAGNSSSAPDEPAGDARGGFVASLGGAYLERSTGRRVNYRPVNLPVGLGAGGLGGMISGMLGIGGGVIKVPIMCMLMKVPVRVAVGTSNFMVGITAMASAFIYFGRGFIDPAITIPVVMGVFLGAQAGSRLSLRLRTAFLARLFAIVLFLVALQMLARATGFRLW